MVQTNGVSMIVTRAATQAAPQELTRSMRNELADVLAVGAVEAGFQPVVDLGTGSVVGWEALARGPRGSALERPDLLFAAARAAGRHNELDVLCQRNALQAALDAGVRAPCALFLNIEPDTSGFLPLDLRELYARACAQMTVVVEITERALTQRPGALLAHIADMRAMGVSVALDDVGTDTDTLAMMSLLQPEVIKLDLALVQASPDGAIAEAVHAVTAQAERTGATILVEGVETLEQARVGHALGATLAQGWLYGRREVLIALPKEPLDPQVGHGRALDPRDLAPVELMRDAREARPATRALLLAMTEHLERQAGLLGRTAVLVASFDRDPRVDETLRRRYADLGRQLAFCALIGRAPQADPELSGYGGLRLAGDLSDAEWAIAVVGPHVASALVAHENGETAADGSPMYDYVLTDDRDLANAVASALTARVSD